MKLVSKRTAHFYLNYILLSAFLFSQFITIVVALLIFFYFYAEGNVLRILLMVQTTMHQKRVVEPVVHRTSLLTGHLKVHHMGEEVVWEAEAGVGVGVVEEEATGKLWFKSRLTKGEDLYEFLTRRILVKLWFKTRLTKGEDFYEFLTRRIRAKNSGINWLLVCLVYF